MTPVFVSSGDLIADRRISYAQMAAGDGAHAEAAELVEQALELVPEWLPGLELLGRYYADAGMLEAARATWVRLLSLDESDPFGAQLKLAAHGMTLAPERPTGTYTEILFDAYAVGFESALVQELHYVVPQLMAEALLVEMSRLGTTGFASALDLGCGTGLMGEQVRARVSYLEGVDLSGAMLAECDSKGIYDRTEKADLLTHLLERSAVADLIVAADVFMYCGSLSTIFQAIAGSLAEGGLFGFSVEAHDGPEEFVVRPSLRYAHSEAGVRAALALAGLDIASLARAVIRHDRGEPLEGFVVIARGPVVTSAPLVDLSHVDLPSAIEDRLESEPGHC